MRQFVVVVAMVSACSSPHGSSPDASDAPPDAPAGCTGPDRDGDGVCDSVDVCPDVFDPGQADLDGDGVGWMCDPLESISLPASQNFGLGTRIHGDTFAGTVAYSCSDAFTCDWATVAVNAYGKALSRADSSLPQDAWTVQTNLGGPYITSDDHVFWSRRFVDEIGTVDLRSGAYSKVVDGFFWNSVVLDDAHVFGQIRTAESTNELALRVPESGQLRQIGVAPDGMATLTFLLTRDPSPMYGFAVQNLDGTSSVETYTAGDTSPVVINANVPKLTSLLLVDGTAPTEPVPAMWLCVDDGTGAKYLRVSATGTTSGMLPSEFNGCPGFALNRVGSALFIEAADFNANTWSLAVIRDGAISLPFVHQPQFFSWNIVGKETPVVELAFTNTPTYQVWALPPGEPGPVLLHSGLSNVSVSERGDTVHVAGVAAGTNGTQVTTIVRYRPSTGVQQATLGLAFAAPSLITTRETGVVVGDGDHVWAIPSTSMVPTLSPLQNSIFGGVAGEYTIIAANTVDVHQTATITLLVYSEVGGVPRFTTLAPKTGIINWFDITVPWFTYASPTSQCTISRVLDDGSGNLTLDTGVPCNGSTAINVRKDGALILSDGLSTLGEATNYLLSPTEVKRVAHSSNGLRNVVDGHGFVVGWIGTDGTGSFACLASHPDRCWSIPVTSDSGTSHVDYPWADASADGGDGRFGFAAVVWDPESKLYIFRSIGTGDRKQPL